MKDGCAQCRGVYGENVTKTAVYPVYGGAMQRNKFMVAAYMGVLVTAVFYAHSSFYVTKPLRVVIWFK